MRLPHQAAAACIPAAEDQTCTLGADLPLAGQVGMHFCMAHGRGALLAGYHEGVWMLAAERGAGSLRGLLCEVACRKPGHREEGHLVAIP